MISGASFSRCKKYRYRLWRIWDESKPKVLFIMLNPGTADSEKNDPTIRRCIEYAKSWGYGGLYVGNLYAYRTSYPSELFKAPSPKGKYNQNHLKIMANESQDIIIAWGNGQGKPKYGIRNLGELKCLKILKDGSPGHPLYLRKEVKPFPYLPEV